MGKVIQVVYIQIHCRLNEYESIFTVDFQVKSQYCKKYNLMICHFVKEMSQFYAGDIYP